MPYQILTFALLLSPLYLPCTFIFLVNLILFFLFFFFFFFIVPSSNIFESWILYICFNNSDWHWSSMASKECSCSNECISVPIWSRVTGTMFVTFDANVTDHEYHSIAWHKAVQPFKSFNSTFALFSNKKSTAWKMY